MYLYQVTAYPMLHSLHKSPVFCVLAASTLCEGRRPWPVVLWWRQCQHSGFPSPFHWNILQRVRCLEGCWISEGLIRRPRVLDPEPQQSCFRAASLRAWKVFTLKCIISTWKKPLCAQIVSLVLPALSRPPGPWLLLWCIYMFIISENPPHVLPYSCSVHPLLHSGRRLPRLPRLSSCRTATKENLHQIIRSWFNVGDLDVDFIANWSVSQTSRTSPPLPSRTGWF